MSPTISRSLIPRLAVCAVMAAALLPCSAKSICADSKIAAGKSLGSLALGMSLDQAIELVGKPGLEEQTGKLDGSEWRKLYYYPGSDFYLIAQDRKVVELALGGGTEDTQSCSTGEGIRLGAKARRVKAAYGEPEEKARQGATTADWTYGRIGIGFTVDSQGGVLGVRVFLPGMLETLKRREEVLGW